MKANKKKRCFIPVIFILLILTGMSFAAEPVAERPVYAQGDFWVFVNRNKSKKVKHTFVREEKDAYVFQLGKSGRERRVYFTSDLKRPPIGYPGPIIAFPLTVGKKWNYRFQGKYQTVIGLLAKHKVEAYEAVTVPAGTFQAFKITVRFEKGGRGYTTPPENMYFWYAPDVKQLVKRSKAKMAENTWELKKYKIK
ncbi:MAG: hypothetical protein P8017_17355 [Deltaproteobacteria bacterium]|jgi:hypothetical protein